MAPRTLACGALLLLLQGALSVEAQAGGGCSQLFGCSGEAWDRSRLPLDWSYAGYAAGEREIPTVRVGANVKDFGAKGDGAADDSAALQRAVDAAPAGTVVYFPAGRYVLTQRYDLRKALVLRGEGKGRTTLFFPKPLADLYGNRGGWGHGTCFLNFWGWNPVRDDRTRLAAVTGASPRGSTTITVDNTGGVKPGQWVRVVLQDKPDVLKATLMGGLMEPGWPRAAKNMVRFTTRVKAVGAGGKVELERGLPWEVRTDWGPTLHAVLPTISDSGVEALTIEFKWTKYPGHLKEDGFNAVHFNQLHNSWVRDVRFLNADAAVYFWGATHCTVQDVELDVTEPRTSPTRPNDWWSGTDTNGHRGIWSEAGESNLFQRIAVRAPFFHDFSVATVEVGSVWTNSWGANLNLDFHKGAPYANLYSDLDLGAGTRAFKSGGDPGAGPNSASYQTFWNLKSQNPVRLPDPGFGPQINFVGVPSQQQRDGGAARLPNGWVQDGAANPPNLFVAMRKQRLGW